MRKARKGSVYLFVLLFVTGCTNWDKKACDGIDFRAYGIQDAQRGKAFNRWHRYDYVQSCEKNGREYAAAYGAGVKEVERSICTFDGGLKFGADGSEPWPGMCESFNRYDFMRGYESGAKDYKIKQLEKKLADEKKANSCTFNSDCGKDGRCSGGKCERKR